MRYYKHLRADMPTKDDVRRLTPNPAIPEVIDYLADQGVETYLDRFDALQPLCRFGLDGTCCRRCLWGPCIVTKTKRGVCGADLPLVVISNHLRMVASGCAAHGQHARNRLETILAILDGRMEGELRGRERVWWLAERYGISREAKSWEELARKVVETMLLDLGSIERKPLRALLALAPAERLETWRKLDIIPTSAFSEVCEALARTSLGADSDWRNVLKHELRVALAFFYGCVIGASFASEILYGSSHPIDVEVGFGTLADTGAVKVAVHGHSPVMAEALAEAVDSERIVEAARQAGADGVSLYGICCTGHELLGRYGIPTLTGILGQEFAIGTGALDAVVVDLQCIIPGIVNVANGFGTRIITTSDSNRLPGALHIPFKPERSREVSETILLAAIEAFRERDHSRQRIPDSHQKVRAGFDGDSILAAFGGRQRMLELLRDGRIVGIATMVSCNTPKVIYEANNVIIARELLRRGVLITTTGCAAHALFNAGLADPEMGSGVKDSLRAVCKEAGVPPVLPVGACVDNTKTMLLFKGLAEEAGLPLTKLPFFYIGAEPGNEKALGMAMSFLAHGIPVLTGYPIPIPVPTLEPREGGGIDDYVSNSNEIADFFAEGALEIVGARIYVESRPTWAAGLVEANMREKRRSLGWSQVPQGSD